LEDEQAIRQIVDLLFIYTDQKAWSHGLEFVAISSLTGILTDPFFEMATAQRIQNHQPNGLMDVCLGLPLVEPASRVAKDVVPWLAY
jgi:hypothetical protein